MLVVPIDSESITFEVPGNKKPRPTPTAIARNIQSVKYLSRNFNFGCILF
ncbi:hypothetical protein BN1088_1432782 [Sphingobacterium sp. PM2-P1-29]|nr:hypothetical protein BN1088_1432782 [Sphingobacterium sp. PM2-P1-29]